MYGFSLSPRSLSDLLATFRGWGRCWGTRVSTVEQNAALQVDELTGGWSLRFSPTTPRGVLDRRPELDAVLAQLGREIPSWCGGWTGSAVRCGI